MHANTTIGLESTRQFVRDTCQQWGLPLIERTPPRESDHYRALVLAQGFPGPAHHFKMYQRLKQRGLRAARRELPTGRGDRVVFLAGRRRDESVRRGKGQQQGVPESEREGSTVWVSPLVHWTKADLNTYRLMHADVPLNETANLLHMSGECLCGSFAKRGEREEVGYWFPEFTAVIEELEALIADRPDIPDYRKTWGWGAERDKIMRAMALADELNYQGDLLDLIPSESGPLCASC